LSVSVVSRWCFVRSRVVDDNTDLSHSPHIHNIDFDRQLLRNLSTHIRNGSGNTVHKEVKVEGTRIELCGLDLVACGVLRLASCFFFVVVVVVIFILYVTIASD
jgi:hypothetical protein